MKTDKPYSLLTVQGYKTLLQSAKTASKINTLGLFRSILENQKLTEEERVAIRDLCVSYFEKTYEFLQVKDPKTYLKLSTLGQEMSASQERMAWDKIRVAQQEILRRKRIKHRSFGTYSKHIGCVEGCVMEGIMVKRNWTWAEAGIRLPNDKDWWNVRQKSYKKAKVQREIQQALRQKPDDLEL